MSRADNEDHGDRITPASPPSRPRVIEQRGDEVDQASCDSFPASDPPAWNGVRLGSPSGHAVPR
jgi:hypothetical protein